MDGFRRLANYSHLHPSCFYVLGTGNKKLGINAGLHTSTFNIDESAIEIGGGLMARLVIKNIGLLKEAGCQKPIIASIC